MSKLTIGNRTVPVDDAREWVTEYTSQPEDPKRPFGYPAYDTYATEDPEVLQDSDLLAPVLLNVRLSIAGYESLQAMVPTINDVLAEIPIGTSILETEPAPLIEQLYAPLDWSPRPHGVKGTSLSKVLHRKRPEFIPLFDREVRKCFGEPTKEQPARIPKQRGRSWSTYMGLLAEAIREDLRGAEKNWKQVQSAGPEERPISLLRCYDIVAWRLGKGNHP